MCVGIIDKAPYLNSTSFFPSPSNHENPKTAEAKGPASSSKELYGSFKIMSMLSLLALWKGERTCKSFSQLVVDDNKLFFEAE